MKKVLDVNQKIVQKWYNSRRRSRRKSGKIYKNAKLWEGKSFYFVPLTFRLVLCHCFYSFAHIRIILSMKIIAVSLLFVYDSIMMQMVRWTSLHWWRLRQKNLSKNKLNADNKQTNRQTYFSQRLNAAGDCDDF